MSTVKTNNVQIGQSGTATNNFTWYQPASPDGTVRLGNGNSGSVTDVVKANSAGVFSMNSGYGSVAPAYGCRAWVNFNQTGTQSIRASGNVSSITDGGVGVTTINFTTAMPDGGYAITMAYSNEVNVYHTVGFITNVTAALTTVSFYNVTNSANTTDKATVGVSFFR